MSSVDFYGRTFRSLADDRHDNPPSIDPTPHVHFHEHGGSRHAHFHAHPDFHAHSSQTDIPAHRPGALVIDEGE